VPAKRIDTLRRDVERARGKDSLKAFTKLTERVDGQIRIANDPPLVVRIADLMPADRLATAGEAARNLLHSYSRTLAPDRRRLLDSYRFVDMARKVVGIGSVGLRCWILLLLGRDDQDPLFLQLKEAQPSVLEPYATKSGYAQQGQRVVDGQRLVQAASDIFLGWERTLGLDGEPRDFYVRQLWDGKLSTDLATLDPGELQVYGEMCGWTLARGHARSGDRIGIAAYLGSGANFDRAVSEFAFAYAEQNARDFAAFQQAARDGRITAAR
jgi:uncharacterized protein (DUF2252 family)